MSRTERRGGGKGRGKKEGCFFLSLTHWRLAEGDCRATTVSTVKIEEAEEKEEEEGEK